MEEAKHAACTLHARSQHANHHKALNNNGLTKGSVWVSYAERVKCVGKLVCGYATQRG